MDFCTKTYSFFLIVFLFISFTSTADGVNIEKNILGMEFVKVEPGSFMMGSNEQDDEKPVHKVTISKPYWIGKYEVSQKEWQKLMISNPSYFKDSSNPVESVKRSDCFKFCEKLTEKERAAGRLPAGYEYRLPTEAEWEYAARGGNKSKGYKYSGSNSVGDVAWYRSNSGNKTHSVGQKKSNELGIYDMSGNVYEWCLDSYDNDYYGKSPGTDPYKSSSGMGSGMGRVNRGGSWANFARDCRSTGRGGYGPGWVDFGLGFRVCLAERLP